jgi:hypothetical protein
MYRVWWGHRRGAKQGSRPETPLIAVMQVCLIGADGTGALHRISPVNDPIESRAHTDDICGVRPPLDPNWRPRAFAQASTCTHRPDPSAADPPLQRLHRAFVPTLLSCPSDRGPRLGRGLQHSRQLGWRRGEYLLCGPPAAAAAAQAALPGGLCGRGQALATPPALRPSPTQPCPPKQFAGPSAPAHAARRPRVWARRLACR